MAGIFELLQHCREDWSVKNQLKVCCAQAVLTISTGSWHTCLALSCNISLILSDCGYTTPNLYQLILSQLGCCSSILLVAGWAWTKLWLLSLMEIYSSHSEPKRRRAGSAPDKFHAQHDCNDCKWTSTELQPTWAVSHTLISQQEDVQSCTSAFRGQRASTGSLCCSTALYTVTSLTLTRGPLEFVLASDVKTSHQQCSHKAEIFQLPTGHPYSLPNLAICARCIRIQMQSSGTCSHWN